MGQYYKPACPDTGEYLYSHAFGDGLKLMEFGSGTAMISGIAALVALPSEDERGSWTGASHLLGAWAGKRLVITGDYADEGRFVPPEYQELNLYSYVGDHGKDISTDVMNALADVAGPSHPMAVRVRKPKGMDDYFYDAPDGMGDYLDLSKARKLQFKSFKELHAFGWQDVGLESEDESLRNFSEALRFIGLKFGVRQKNEISNLKVTQSEDGMRVETIRFNLNGRDIRWDFPLAVATVFEVLGIIRPDDSAIWGAKAPR
jgi:hypothetical protein